MTSTIFAALDAAILSPVLSFVSQASNGVSTWATAPLATAFAIYVFVHGGAVLLGKIADPLSELLLAMVRYGVILTLIGAQGHYSDWVVELFLNSLPNEIATAMAMQPASASAFDALIDQSVSLSAAIWKSTGSFDVAAMLVNGMAGLLLMLLVAVMATVGYAVWVFSKIALALCLALGPAFIALALFPSTRRFTESWLGTLANYVILQVLTVGLLSMLLKVFQAQMVGKTGLDPLLALPPVIVVSISAFYLFHQLPSIASALAGGGAALGIGWSARRDAAEGLTARGAMAGTSAIVRGASFIDARIGRRGSAAVQRVRTAMGTRS